MSKVLVSEIEGVVLDWAVAKCEGLRVDSLEGGNVWAHKQDALTGESEKVMLWRPTRNWADGGPIIDRSGITIVRVGQLPHG